MRFATEDLFSKYGFDDGSLLRPLLQEHGFDDLDSHDALFAVVSEFVLPELDTALAPRRVFSAHNPIRVRDEEGCDQPFPGGIWPRVVEVSDAEIIAFLPLLRDNQADQRVIEEGEAARKRIELRMEAFRLRRKLTRAESELADLEGRA